MSVITPPIMGLNFEIDPVWDTVVVGYPSFSGVTFWAALEVFRNLQFGPNSPNAAKQNLIHKILWTK